MIEEICGLFRIPGISEDYVKRKLLFMSYLVMLVFGSDLWMKEPLLNGVY